MTAHHEQGSMNEHDKSRCIAGVPIFNHLSQDEMAEIAQITTSSQYERGELLFFSGSDAEILYILHTGMMKQVRVTQSGQEQIVRILHPGDFVGELALFGRQRLEGYAEALESTEVCRLRGEDLRKLLVKFPAIGVKILEEVTERLGEAEARIEQLGAHSVAQRVAGFLLQLAEHGHNKKRGLLVTLPFSKRDFASLIGTSQETLSRKLAAFQDSGWISMEGQRDIIIKDLQSLRAVTTGKQKP